MKVSNCCSARITSGLCGECHEHCDAIDLEIEGKFERLAEALKDFSGDDVQALITWEINDDVPEGFTKADINREALEYDRYEKVIEARDGIPTKVITLLIHE